MILALDTATRWTGIGLHDGTTVVTELGWKTINTQTIELAPTVLTFLRKANVDPADLSGIAVTIGPGSYTGLRIGLGFAKGMALAHQTPLIGIPTLDVVAHSFGADNAPLFAIAEAGRGRVCAGRYEWQGKHWQPAAPPDIFGWDALLSQIEGPAIFAGEISAESRKQIRQTSKQFRVVNGAAGVRRAGFLAELAWHRLKHGRIDDPAALVPIYLRTPEGQPLQPTAAS